MQSPNHSSIGHKTTTPVLKPIPVREYWVALHASNAQSPRQDSTASSKPLSEYIRKVHFSSGNNGSTVIVYTKILPRLDFL